MKTTTIFAAMLCLLLAGCASPIRTASMASCKTVSVPATCLPAGTPPEITVNTNGLTFAPPNACVKAGDTIKFKLEPTTNNEIGNAAINSKNPAHTWLNGTNTADKDKIEIVVPSWVPPGKYNYGLYLSDGSCVDPRVVVER